LNLECTHYNIFHYNIINKIGEIKHNKNFIDFDELSTLCDTYKEKNICYNVLCSKWSIIMEKLPETITDENKANILKVIKIFNLYDISSVVNHIFSIYFDLIHKREGAFSSFDLIGIGINNT